MTRRLGLIGLLLLSTAGCHRRDATLAPTSPAFAPPSPQASAESVLEGLDTRVPVPLLPHMAQHQKENMREHLVAVQDIALAAARGDFPAIEHASEGLALSPGMARMCEHMGKGAAGFTEQALTFHRSADAITAAARRHDNAAVMNALGATLQRCTGCHATFRQKIVDEATWTRLTADAPHAAGSGMSGG